MFRSTAFDKTLDKATSHLLMEPDWNANLQICDLIRQNDIQPKYVLSQLKKKMYIPNQHTAMYALLVLEAIVKNCGNIVHEELTSRSFCEFLHELIKTTTYDNVRQKLLELIQAWNVAFRKNPKFGALKDTMAAMKAEGYKFPASRESDAMFTADSAPEWADGDVCHRCRVAFNLIQRKHHCRACGQVFCSQCTQKATTLPKYGIEKEVRVCDPCYDQANKPTTKVEKESELPPEYVNSSLAQQSQSPPRKTEEELREEEELNLALAISQSEAEAKEKEKFKLVSTYKAPEPQVERTPSPFEEHSNPELARYLNRSYWETLNQNEINNRPASPSAPATITNNLEKVAKVKENGVTDSDMEEFINTLKSQVEIFINRMKSNSSRGRSIANDSSVQTLFMNITQMHSQLLRYIQQHDDRRLYYERLQDKLTQVKDARAALDDLREEYREKLRREAEEAERQRQLQMAHKLEIMRKKKQEYLQYQRQLALQRIQEQEREMQMRQEQQKQQYLMGGQQYGPFIGSPVHGPFPPPPPPPTTVPAYGYQYGQMMPPPPPLPQQVFTPSQLPMQQPQQFPIRGPMMAMPQNQQFQQPIAPPHQHHPQPQQHQQPQQQQQPPPGQHTNQENGETQTAELISFD